MKQGLCTYLVICGSCSVATEQHTAVTEANSLGVVAISVAHFTRGQDSVFELEGLDDQDAQVALVRLRKGTLNVPPFVGTDVVGSEITVSVDGKETHFVSRELELFRLPPIADPTTEEFLQLSEVSSALERNANIIVRASAGTESAYTVITNARACTASELLTSPTARKCCDTYGNEVIGGNFTTFLTDADGNGSLDVVTRQRNYYNTGCKASDGVSACSGTACYYGPIGYARATFVYNPYNGLTFPYVTTIGPLNDRACYGQWSSTAHSSTFGDVIGSNPTGQGCPGGASGGSWDYP